MILEDDRACEVLGVGQGSFVRSFLFDGSSVVNCEVVYAGGDL